MAFEKGSAARATGPQRDGAERLFGRLALLAAAAIWGGMYAVSFAALQRVPPLALLWLRYTIALLVLLPAAGLRRERVARRHWPRLVLIGLVGYVVSIWAQFIGTALTSAAMGAVVTALSPVFLAVAAALVAGEPIRWRGGVALALATVGALLVGGVGTRVGGGIGFGVLLLAAITWGVQSAVVKTLPRELPSLALSAWPLAVAWVVLTPLVAAGGMGAVVRAFASPGLTAAVLYLGLGATTAAVVLWNYGLRRVGAAAAGVYFLFQPLVGVAAGMLFLGERVGRAAALGSALILGAAWFASVGEGTLDEGCRGSS
jgi:drug/metabolite transporter (DMT)-like permease